MPPLTVQGLVHEAIDQIWKPTQYVVICKSTNRVMGLARTLPEALAAARLMFDHEVRPLGPAVPHE